MRVLVMGVAGCGKSTLGATLAAALDLPLVEADALHDAEAIARMASGQGLDEARRAPWLDRVRTRMDALPGGCVVACSALRRAHRQRLGPDLVVHLTLDEEAARARLAARTGHFAGPALVDSQFAALEPWSPDEGAGVALPADLPTARQVAAVRRLLAGRGEG